MNGLLRRIPAGARLLLLLLAAVYAAFLTLDILFPAAYPASNLLKYGGVLLCFALAAFSPGGAARRALLAALGFTLAADALLLFTGAYEAGIFLFCCAQLAHIRRFYKRAFLPAALFLLAALAWRVLFAGQPLAGARLPQAAAVPPLYVTGAAYGVLLLCALGTSFAPALPRGCALPARAGMVLFLLCDIHVALYNLLPAGNGYLRPAAVLMWAFYLPSQALLAFSAGAAEGSASYAGLR